MQNWDSLQPASYDLNWYNNMFSMKNDNQSSSSAITDQSFNMKQSSSMDEGSSTPSPKAGECQGTNFIEHTGITTSSNQNPLGFNPLTPPGLPNAVLPSMNFETETNHILPKQQNDKINENSLTPRNTPPVDVTPPKSPKLFNNNDISDRDNDIISNSSEDTRFLESEDDELIRVPIYNSHGKMKNYKCKHCGFMAITKVSFWNHAREHIKPEKMLQCPKCPFVTELKHHLEYHIRKHKNLKPFQCDKCSYSCVNKSMLNSHLKSHSSVYQYRCSDCDYATKYCHSFKLHLRKYEHKPGMVLDEDGTPNPSVIIDVYGTRRGPKMKSGKTRSKSDVKREVDFDSKFSLSNDKNACQQNHINTKSCQSQFKTQNGKNVTSTLSNLLPNNLANMLHQTRNMSLFPYFNLNLQMIAAQQHAAWTQMSPQIQKNVFSSYNNNEIEISTNNSNKDSEDVSEKEDNQSTHKKRNPAINDAMDLSQIKANEIIQNDVQFDDHHHNSFKDNHNNNGVNTPTITSSSVKRKSRILKMDNEEYTENSTDELHKETTNSMDFESNNEINEKRSKNSSISETKIELPSSSQDDIKIKNPNENYNKKLFLTSSSSSVDCNTSSSSQIISQIPGIYECKYCDIYFKDAVLYTIHMGYHSCDDVFKCNMCGEKCDGPVGLFIHMARNAHS